MSYIGKSIERVDARSKVTGEAIYPGDINLPDQAYMKVMFARRPHAIVKSIDYKSAEDLDGVLIVLTAKDVPVNEYGLTMFDQPVLCGPGSEKPYTDRVRFIGDQVAVVVAESKSIAETAIELIKVEYEDLPVLSDPITSMKDDHLLHPDKGSNIYQQYKIRKGDVEEAFEMIKAGATRIGASASIAIVKGKDAGKGNY